MVQRCDGTSLALEALVERDRRDLDRDVAAQPSVVGFVDLAHPSVSQERNDLVGTDALAGRERHWRLKCSALLTWLHVRMTSRAKDAEPLLAAPSSGPRTINECGSFHWTLSTRPSIVMLLH